MERPEQGRSRKGRAYVCSLVRVNLCVCALLHGSRRVLSIAANTHAFSWEVLRLPARPGNLSVLVCVCGNGSSPLQHTRVCPKTVNFLPQPKRRNGVIAKEDNEALFHSAASPKARVRPSAANR